MSRLAWSPLLLVLAAAAPTAQPDAPGDPAAAAPTAQPDAPGDPAAAAPVLQPAPADVDAERLAVQAAERLRSDAFYLEASLEITARRADRLRVRFRAWDDRLRRRTFIQVVGPGPAAGTRFLHQGPNVWVLAPGEGGARRIPPSEMLERWMGSHFTNGDWLDAGQLVDAYRHRVLGVARSPTWAPGASFYALEYLPRQESPGLWGRIVAWVDVESGLPRRLDYFDSDGVRRRELTLEDPRPVQGRPYPHRWRMRRTDKEVRETVLEVQEVRLDQRLDGSIFTARHLLDVGGG